MLLYTFYYLIASILIFQGTNACAEIVSPMGIVPEELSLEKSKGELLGCILFAYGYFSVIFGIVSHFFEFLQIAIVSVMGLGIFGMLVFVCFILFDNRKVDYLGRPSANSDHH